MDFYLWFTVAQCGSSVKFGGSFVAEIMVSQQPTVPVMHWRKFAELVGIEEPVCRGLCEKGYLPCVTIGKHRFINLVRLAADCASGELGRD